VTENICRVGVDSSYRDADNCQGYTVCVAGEAFSFVCPKQLVFNPQLHFCDFDLHNSCPRRGKTVLFIKTTYNESALIVSASPCSRSASVKIFDNCSNNAVIHCKIERNRSFYYLTAVCQKCCIACPILLLYNIVSFV